MIFTKSDLVYKDYNWDAVYNYNDSRIMGELDQTLLNRTEGFEIVYFINKCRIAWDWKSKQAMKRLETTIRNEVPGYIKTQSAIKNWIEQNIYQQHSLADLDMNAMI